MLLDVCNFQRRYLHEHIDSHTASLVRGTQSRDDDQRIRGIIHGLWLAIGIVDDVEARAKVAENE